MSTVEIPFSFLSSNPCAFCGLVINGGRIYLQENDCNSCGRCSMYSNDYRNLAYEALASTFQYPCKNWKNHCSAKLHWRDSMDHEEECSYSGCCSIFFNHPGVCFKGERKFPKNNIVLRPVPENSMQFLTCSYCNRYLNCDPIYLNANNQNICHRCVRTNGIPPDGRRNLPYEKIATLFLFPCIHKNIGCTEQIQFGQTLWQHETNCPCYQAYLKPPKIENTEHAPRPNQAHLKPPKTEKTEDVHRPNIKKKEKGLIRTQTGVIWATLTPNTLLFAPPEDQKSNLNNDVVKSLMKKQGRQIRRANEIGDEMGRRNSESESISTNRSAGTSDISELSPRSTPLSTELNYSNRPPSSDLKYSNYPEMNEHVMVNEQRGRAPTSRTKEYESTAGQYQAELAGHFPAMMPQQLNGRYEAEMAGHLPAMIPRQSSSSRETTGRYEAEMAGHFPAMMSRQSNNNRMHNGGESFGRYEFEMASHFPAIVSRQPSNRINVNNSREQYEAEMASHYPRRTTPIGEHEAAIAGHFPIMLPRQFNDGFDSMGRRASKMDSFRGNTVLINELKMKQDMIKRNHSIRNQNETNPYQNCNNLGDIRYVHSQLT